MRYLTLAIFALTVACSEASTSPDNGGPVGTYTLQSIDGDALPHQSIAIWSCLPGPFGCAGPHIIRSLVITVRADGTWTSVYDWSQWMLVDGHETFVHLPDGSMSGDWSLWDADVVFRSNSLDDPFFVGAVDGSTMTLDRNFVLTRASRR